MLLRSNEQLALRSAEVVDLTSCCVGPKEEDMTDREGMHRLADEVCCMKAEADQREEEMRQMKENLEAVTVEWDESWCQVTEASLCVDSLTRDLETEWSEGQGLRARMGGKRCCLVLSFWVSSGYVSSSLSSQTSRRIWTPPSRPL